MGLTLWTPGTLRLSLAHCCPLGRRAGRSITARIHGPMDLWTWQPPGGGGRGHLCSLRGGGIYRQDAGPCAQHGQPGVGGQAGLERPPWATPTPQGPQPRPVPVGEHPRMGALDVCPFIPVRGVTMDECVLCAQAFGQQLAEELGVPGEHPKPEPQSLLTALQARGQWSPALDSLKARLFQSKWMQGNAHFFCDEINADRSHPVRRAWPLGGGGLSRIAWWQRPLSCFLK